MPKNLLLKLFFLSIGAKIIASFFLPVLGDETYYWFWGQNLQLSYFDHPPFVAWMTWFSGLFSFLPYWLSLRMPFIVLSSATFIIWVKCLKLDSNCSKNFLILFSAFYFLHPLLGLGGLVATPDVPLMFFWALSYWALQNALITQKKLFYSLLGVFLGLGFCSKYHIVLFPLTAVASLFFTKQIRLVQWPKTVWTITFGLLFCTPVVFWNYQNDWASFRFQLNHGFQSTTYAPTWTLYYLLGQIFLFNPFLVLPLWRACRDKMGRNMAFFQWLFFFYSSLKANVEANWPITAHAQGLAAIHFQSKKELKFALGYWIFIWLIFIGFCFSSFGSSKIGALPSSNQARAILEEINNYQPLYGPSYQMSSLLTYMSGQQIPKLNKLGRFDFYDTLDISKPTENIFYVLKYDISVWPDWMTSYAVESIKTIPAYKLQLYKVTRE